jgi:D-beta-D-heptose 7-phosphate kinase / D-beta-D-heptose 1-phosphate adenosyltransferase
MSSDLALPPTRDLRILVLGEAILDRYLWGAIDRISPEAPIPVLQVVRREERPGNAAFVCANLIALGAAPRLVSVTGADMNGALLTESLADLGVQTRGVVEDRSRPTIVKERMLGWVQSAQRGTQQLLRVDNEDTRPIGPEVEQALLDALEEEIPEMDGALVCDVNKGVLTARVLRMLIDAGRALHKPVVIDPRLAPDYSLYRGATALTPNRYETERAIGLSLAKPDAWPAAARHLIERFDLDLSLITLDRDGLFLGARDGRATHLPTNPREVYDVTGAGDIVLTFFGLLLAGGCDPEVAAQVANVAAGLEVTKQGAAIIGRQEIEMALEQRHEISAHKIVGADELPGHLEAHRLAGRRICFTNGCFDLLHAGHIKLLEFARRQGDLLVVGLNSDASVRQLKGEGRPVYPQEDRARMLAALEAVDYVILFDNPRAEGIIRFVRPDILVKGEDYRGQILDGSEFVHSYGGRVVLAPLLDGRGTTRTIERLGTLAGGKP